MACAWRRPSDHRRRLPTVARRRRARTTGSRSRRRSSSRCRWPRRAGRQHRLQYQAEGIDDDIREIFLEEMQEEIDNLRACARRSGWPIRRSIRAGQHPPLVPYAEGFRPTGRRRRAGRVCVESGGHAQPRARQHHRAAPRRAGAGAPCHRPRCRRCSRRSRARVRRTRRSARSCKPPNSSRPAGMRAGRLRAAARPKPWFARA